LNYTRLGSQVNRIIAGLTFGLTSTLLPMEITLNGELKTVQAGISVLGLLQTLGLEDKRVAVEVSGEIVPRSQHATHLLVHGNQIEVVVAVGGG